MMHPLEGPRIKVLRAKEQIGLLQSESQRFFNREVGGAFIGEFNRKTRMYPLRLRKGVEVPLDWGVLIGEIIHNLRSALDGLVYQLAKPREAQPKGTEFPIFLVGRPRGCRRGRGKKGKGCSAGGDHFHCRGRDRISLLRREHRADIERLQPYKRWNGQGQDPLWLLHEINNADKHRLIVVAGGYSMGISVAPIEGGVYLEPNAEI